jgi:AcrR family transcriptional regulator
MQSVLDAVAERLLVSDENLIRIPDICEATGVNYGSVYHHFGSREGVIDAAYLMLFERFVEEDIEAMRVIDEEAQGFENYVLSLRPVLDSYSSPERQERRAVRMRIVAAALTRPTLRLQIGAVQQRITKNMAEVITRGQERGWIRRDLSAQAIAVLLQVIVIGRVLDDISAVPVDAFEWSATMAVLATAAINFPT